MPMSSHFTAQQIKLFGHSVRVMIRNVLEGTMKYVINSCFDLYLLNESQNALWMQCFKFLFCATFEKRSINRQKIKNNCEQPSTSILKEA